MVNVKKHPKAAAKKLRRSGKSRPADSHDKGVKTSDQNKNSMESELKKHQKNIVELKEKNIRLLAEFDNFKRRTNREKDRLLKYSLEDFAKAIIPIVDDLQRTIDSVKEKDKDDPLLNGIMMVKNKFDKILKENGVAPFHSVGEKFDPELHDALMIQEAEDAESQTILQEFEKGYKYHDKVIRHAKVVVAK